MSDKLTIEAVAKAIFNAHGGYKIGWGNISDKSRAAYLHQAAYAIKAYEAAKAQEEEKTYD